MAQSATQVVALPLVDDVTVKDLFADACAGLNFSNGNVHMTFASVTVDHRTDSGPASRIVSARVVLPIGGAIEFRDLLTRMIDMLIAQRAIVPMPSSPPPTIVDPAGRPH